MVGPAYVVAVMVQARQGGRGARGRRQRGEGGWVDAASGRAGGATAACAAQVATQRRGQRKVGPEAMKGQTGVLGGLQGTLHDMRMCNTL